MQGYSTFSSITPTATGQTIATIIGTSTKSVRLKGISFASGATPTNAKATFQVREFTAKGTKAGDGSNYYNNKAFGLTPDITSEYGPHSVEPTYVSGNGIRIVVHQMMGDYYWEAPPDMWCDPGSNHGWGVYYVDGPLVAWEIKPDWEQ